MNVSGWGRYPVIDTSVKKPLTVSQLQTVLVQGKFCGITRGLGRSYGDSSLAKEIISTLALQHFLSFDEKTGLLTCAAGVSLADILHFFVPKGWFLPVTPGTKFVTVGGAIASDVHGKNHHIDGCFSNYLVSFQLMLATGEIINCARDENSELFYATCGGMGLTGIIVEATFQLKPIKSAYLSEKTIKLNDIEALLHAFEIHSKVHYSVAWIDCMTTGKALGRGLLMMGEHVDSGELVPGTSGKITVPVNMPRFLLNPLTIRAFNALYYHRIRKQASERMVHYEPFFYPLDSIHQWNRIYGKQGFIQYQFVIPKSNGLKGMVAILEHIAKSKRGSFLAVLKAFGSANANYLSFPMEGYTLALDFKWDKTLLALLDELDKLVLSCGGRIYLTKDVRMSSDTFKQSYPNWEAFKNIREKYRVERVFKSLQSERLEI